MVQKRFPLLGTLLTLLLLAGLVFVAAQNTGGAATGGAMTGGEMTGGAVTGGAMTGGAMTGGADGGAVVLELGDERVTAQEFEGRFNVALRNLAAQQGIPLDPATLAQFEALKPAFLEQFATERVLLQEAEARGVTPSEEDVNTQFEGARENAGENFGALLEQGGFENEEALRQLIRESLALQSVVEGLESEVQVDDAAVTAYYEANQAQFERPEEVCARHILVEDEATANELLERIEGGVPFAQVAQNNSTDPGSAPNGGDLGCLPRGATVPEFEEAAFATEVGETTGPVQSDFGYHLIRVYERNPAQTAPLEEVRPEIEGQLQGEGLNEQIASLVEASGVQTYPENLLAVAPAAPTPPPGGAMTGGAMTGGAMTGGAMTGGAVPETTQTGGGQ